MKDYEVIEAFIYHLRKNGHKELVITCWPDKKNRSSKDIDAVAGQFAIEHTSIDSVPNQRQHDDWFSRALGVLEFELSNRLPFRLKIIIPHHGIDRGQDWEIIRENFRNWILTQSPNMEEYKIIPKDIPGIPFQFYAIKGGINPGLLFSRLEPTETKLVERIRNLLDKKASKLALYHCYGMITVLLVENGDFALMDNGTMWDSLQEAYPDGLPDGVDSLWYADTCIPDHIEFFDFTRAFQKTLEIK